MADGSISLRQWWQSVLIFTPSASAVAGGLCFPNWADAAPAASVHRGKPGAESREYDVVSWASVSGCRHRRLCSIGAARLIALKQIH